jgi:hypothetical protein
MGTFINSQADNEICEVLNKRFSDEVNPNDLQRRTFIALLRDHFQNKENLFDAGHNLHRVFHRLAISVTGGTRVPKTKASRFRWLFLLRSKLPAAVTQAIKDQLTAILSPASLANPAGAVDYVSFSTKHVTPLAAKFVLWPGNNSVPSIYADSNGKQYCKIVLECRDDAALSDNNETDPPDPDGGEKNISLRKTSVSKTAKKSSAKKAAPKKSSRKKAAAKKRKSKQ